MTRCSSMLNAGIQCVDREGHFDNRHPHWAQCSPSGVTRWGVVTHGNCGDNECNRSYNHEMPHRDGRGRSWWPLDEEDLKELEEMGIR